MTANSDPNKLKLRLCRETFSSVLSEPNLFQIEPFASLVNTVRSTVPRLLLNRNAVGPFEKVPLRRGDHMELGDLVDTVRRFAEILGWHSDIQDLMRSQENGVGSRFVCRNATHF